MQRLERMIALGSACHQVKHLGHANTTGHSAQARAHLADVNAWSLQQTDRYIAEGFATWVGHSVCCGSRNGRRVEGWRVDEAGVGGCTGVRGAALSRLGGRQRAVSAQVP